jgi:hypothetical protein
MVKEQMKKDKLIYQKYLGIIVFLSRGVAVVDALPVIFSHCSVTSKPVKAVHSFRFASPAHTLTGLRSPTLDNGQDDR